MQIKGRLTRKKLIKWINDKFIELCITDYFCFEINQTRFTSNQYEGGACQLIIRFHHINETEQIGSFTCDYRISDLEEYINNGYEMYLKAKNIRLFSLSMLDLEVRKLYKKK